MKYSVIHNLSNCTLFIHFREKNFKFASKCNLYIRVEFVTLTY